MSAASRIIFAAPRPRDCRCTVNTSHFGKWHPPYGRHRSWSARHHLPRKTKPPSTIAAAALRSFIRSARSTRRRHHRSPRPLVQLDREVVPDDIPVHMAATLDVQRRTARSRQRASCPAGSSPKVPHTNVSPAIPSNSISSPHAQRSQQRITVEHHTPLHPRDCGGERELGVNSA